MPNKHSVNKNFISFSFDIELLHKLTKAAEMQGKTRTQFVLDVLDYEVNKRLKIKLDDDEVEKVKDEIREKKIKRGPAGKRGRKAGVKTGVKTRA